MNFLFRKSQEQDKYPAINTFEGDDLRETYLNSQSEKQNFQPEKQDSQMIRIGEVQAIFGNKHLQDDREKCIQDMGFLKKREQTRLSTDEESWTDRQSPLNFIIISGVLVMTIVGGWGIYHWMSISYDQPPPVIAADQTPFKLRPENPGGLVIPHQDKLVYGRIMPEQQQSVEHLLPQPEQPMDLPNQTDEHGFYPSDSYSQDEYQSPGYSEDPYGPQNQTQGTMNPHATYPQTTYPQEEQNLYNQEYVANPYDRMPHTPASQQYRQELPSRQAVSLPHHAQELVPPAHASQQPIGGAQNQRGQEHPMNTRSQQYGAPITQHNSPYENDPQREAAPTQRNYEQRINPAYAQQSQTKTETPAPLPEERSLEFSRPSKQTALYQPFSPPAYNDGDTSSQTAGNKNDDTEKTALDALIEEEMSGRAPLKSDENLSATKASTGSYRLQVATFPSESEAENEVKRLRHLDPTLMKNVKFIVQKFKSAKSNKIMYRVMIGFFKDAKTANQIKNKLKIHRVAAIIVKN